MNRLVGKSYDFTALVLCSAFGAGYSSVAPGTVGTLVGILPFFALHKLSIALYIAVVTAITILSIPLCSRAEKLWNESDSSKIVLDEVVGFLVTMTAVAPGALSIILGFLYFRIFDIVKPWPARLFDTSVHGGTGVMLDDVIAGVYACGALHATLYFFN